MNGTSMFKRFCELKDFVSNGLRGYKKWDLLDIDELTQPTEEDNRKISEYIPPIEPTQIEKVFRTYGYKAEYVDHVICPSVTVYEVSLALGTRIAQLIKLERDIARDLGLSSIRIVDRKNSPNIGIEVPNKDRLPLYFKETIEQLSEKMEIPVVFGEDTYGETIIRDLIKMPHLLVAGQTGSGKSVFLNSLISTVLATKKPQDVQLLLVDPKGNEFMSYDDVPHLLQPTATSLDDARELLEYAIEEMGARFELLKDYKCRKLSDYNEKSNDKLPYIVLVVDEFADLMLAGTPKERKEIEDMIVRVAQKARAVGIHLVLATQKPIAKVMTTLIKSNMPARVSFRVPSWNDSKVILDEKGAENLIGHGDMLFCDPLAIDEADRIKRIQAPWIPDEDIEIITNQ